MTPHARTIHRRQASRNRRQAERSPSQAQARRSRSRRRETAALDLAAVGDVVRQAISDGVAEAVAPIVEELTVLNEQLTTLEWLSGSRLELAAGEYLLAMTRMPGRRPHAANEIDRALSRAMTTLSPVTEADTEDGGPDE